jgi:hypothetical protein
MRKLLLLLLILSVTNSIFSQTVSSRDNSVEAGKFKIQPGVRAVLENFFYETQFKVLSFDITFSGEGFDDIIYHNNIGAAWDHTCKGYISRCKPGTELIIENVLVFGPDNRTRKLHDVLLYRLR